MTRPLRIEYADAWYQVMNRGRRGDTIFHDGEDCLLFLALLKETSEMFKVRLSAYCLMANYCHILVQTPDANLARVVRQINGVYNRRNNRRRNSDGQLFRRRCKSVLVEESNNLLEVLRYIHLNPVRAGVCVAADE